MARSGGPWRRCPWWSADLERVALEAMVSAAYGGGDGSTSQGRQRVAMRGGFEVDDGAGGVEVQRGHAGGVAEAS